MHDAARNVFEDWVPGPLARDPEGEQERAVRWINRRLRANPDLPTAVRTTLSRIKDSLEQEIGRAHRRGGGGGRIAVRRLKMPRVMLLTT